MKNLLLGLSLGANVVLGYLVLRDYVEVDFEDLDQEASNLGDQVEGKAKQVKGALTGNTSDKLKGDFQSGKGELKEKADNVKDEIKNKLDD
ncbi:hypothetical protein BGL34_05945 [Fructilactobacillus lindneri]|uniref:CsbD-like domain-containing protein n=2 Tax=Fructilactobacillus lindneri TaxID=53444 RepID=A0A0R2JY52_9LACO|nr:CsbD family protein [Fructilactobacillus lindneri]ANZ57456.1 hypothetical protein AYR60_00970 [Fructilactobacillus lindneri]ANZ58724.1 hypothetical protein AYR59_00970 [Fructilactobacillus lindneri]KRN80069.1 hypothetical protein IV52_GL000187 [Fructilactobacillus lindneri DSM 20690 = JCM 11027]POG97942.1 hypothetical protein BGL31_05410 [Fructilactobacillus lindneri]POG99274.1 hypothetical protein BGL32_05435 [Fructilactobacillus lindneri]